MASSACEETTQQGSIFEIWFPVLKVAHMWQCDAIHKHAIKNMPHNQIDKTLGEKLRLAVQYHMPPWIPSGVNELVQRREPLGMDDLACLGPELTLTVAAVRESLGINNRGGFYGAPKLISESVNGSRDASTVDFTPAIKGVFFSYQVSPGCCESLYSASLSFSRVRDGDALDLLIDGDIKNEMDAADAPKGGPKRKVH